MPLRPDSLTWVCEILNENEGMKAEPETPNGIIINTNDADTLRCLVLHERRVTLSIVQQQLEQDHQFVLNIPGPAKSIWEGSAIDFCMDRGVSWGGLGDLFRAASEGVPGQEPKRLRFAHRMLRQHENVSSVDRIFDEAFEVSRRKGPPLKIGLCYAYELTADEVRTAYDRHGPFDVLFDTNPNGGPTSAALDAAAQLGLYVGKARETARRLHDPK